MDLKNNIKKWNWKLIFIISIVIMFIAYSAIIIYITHVNKPPKNINIDRLSYGKYNISLDFMKSVKDELTSVKNMGKHTVTLSQTKSSVDDEGDKRKYVINDENNKPNFFCYDKCFDNTDCVKFDCQKDNDKNYTYVSMANGYTTVEAYKQNTPYLLTIQVGTENYNVKYDGSTYYKLILVKEDVKDVKDVKDDDPLLYIKFLNKIN